MMTKRPAEAGLVAALTPVGEWGRARCKNPKPLLVVIAQLGGQILERD
jgi:hypothetical protein